MKDPGTKSTDETNDDVKTEEGSGGEQAGSESSGADEGSAEGAE